jgi:hypothetical protein
MSRNRHKSDVHLVSSHRSAQSPCGPEGLERATGFEPATFTLGRTLRGPKQRFLADSSGVQCVLSSSVGAARHNYVTTGDQVHALSIVRTSNGSNSSSSRPPRGSIPSVLRHWQNRITMPPMKTLTVRLTDALAAEIEAESRRRRISKSDVVRLLLSKGSTSRRRAASLESILDLIGSVDGLPADLSARKKHYLRKTRYGK